MCKAYLQTLGVNGRVRSDTPEFLATGYKTLDTLMSRGLKGVPDGSYILHFYTDELSPRSFPPASSKRVTLSSGKVITVDGKVRGKTPKKPIEASEGSLIRPWWR